MKIAVCFMIFVASAAGTITESNGLYHALLSFSFRKCFHGKNLNLNPRAVHITFNDYANDYTASFPINKAAEGILNIPGINTSNKFVIFVPGYLSSMTLKTRKLIKESFRDPGVYVITLQDLLYTNPLPNPVSGYERSVLYVYHIGKALAGMLITLWQNGVPSENIHIIGHSLGAHISGNAGDIFFEETGNKVARISGLDPAGPCYDDPQNQLKSGAADFVDVYHCNANQLGTNKDLGDVNFYVNNGVSQPGCGTPFIPDITLSSVASFCGHMACQNFFFLTVSQPELFPAFKCNSYQNFQDGACSGDQTVAGYWTPDSVRGIYYTSTAGHNINRA